MAYDDFLRDLFSALGVRGKGTGDAKSVNEVLRMIAAQGQNQIGTRIPSVPAGLRVNAGIYTPGNPPPASNVRPYTPPVMPGASTAAQRPAPRPPATTMDTRMYQTNPVRKGTY